MQNWKGNFVPVTVIEEWLIGLRGSEALQAAFQAIEFSDPNYNQKMGEALYYQDDKIKQWCLDQGASYQDPSEG